MQVHNLPFSSHMPVSTRLRIVQDADTNRDREFSENLDGMLQDPDYDIRWNVPIVYTGTSRAPASTTTQPPAAPNASSYVFSLLSLHRIDLKPGRLVRPTTHPLLKQAQSSLQRYKPC